MNEALALYLALVGVLVAAITATVIAGIVRDRNLATASLNEVSAAASRENANLRAALAAANAHLAEVIAMRDAAWDDLRTARISAIAAGDDLRTARADRDRAIRAYQSAADAAATAETVGRNFQRQRNEVLTELHETRETLAVTTRALETANAALANWEHTHIECDATICSIADERDAALAIAARWERIVGDCTLGDICGIARDRDDK